LPLLPGKGKAAGLRPVHGLLMYQDRSAVGTSDPELQAVVRFHAEDVHPENQRRRGGRQRTVRPPPLADGLHVRLAGGEAGVINRRLLIRKGLLLPKRLTGVAAALSE